MNYPEWNNAIGRSIFNEDNSGKEVLLYLTKQDLIAIGKTFCLEESDEAVWRSYLLSIKFGVGDSSGKKGSDRTIPENAQVIYQRRIIPGSGFSINRVPVNYPLYLSYLVFFVLPLTEGAVAGDFSLTNYWKRMKQFLLENRCQEFHQSAFRDCKMNALWDDLQTWANKEKNGELGLFTVNDFVNSRFEYVSKPFSQCVLPPKTIAKFPILFTKAGMIPGERYTDPVLRQHLVSYGENAHIHPNVLGQIKTNPDDELAHYVVKIVRREYETWDGQTDSGHSTSHNERQQRYETLAKLVLQLEVNEDYGEATTFYRLRSQNEFPEDLKLDKKYEVRSERNGFSEPLPVPFHHHGFDLRDDFNKWIAKWPVKGVRVFVNGSYYQLDSDSWIEVENLIPGQTMYVLYPVKLQQQILRWADSSCDSCIRMDDIAISGAELKLVKIANARSSCSEIPELYLDTNLSIQLTGGLKVKHRIYADVAIPRVEVINGLPEDSVYLRYEGRDEIILLERIDNSHYWELPANIEIGRPFRLGVQNKNHEEELSWQIVSTSGISVQLGDSHLPYRNACGNIVKDTQGETLRGICLSNPYLLRQKSYEPVFRGSTQECTGYEKAYVPIQDIPGDKLLAYLTLRKVSSAKDFFIAFEQLYNKGVLSEMFAAVNTRVQRLKWSALAHFANLGFVDYDYENDEISVLPPQLILIPTIQDRKALLIGGRDRELLKNISELAPQYELTLTIDQQAQNANLILPSIVTLQTHQHVAQPRYAYGERQLNQFANAAGLRIDINNFVQAGLQFFSADIVQYETDILANNREEAKDYDWARYVFNTGNLQLEQSQGTLLDKQFAFVEYRLNTWQIYHRIWIGGECYNVDKNWGRYLALKKAGKNVICHDSKNDKVAIPFDVPLPRYFAMSLCLLSGKAPSFCKLNGRTYRVYENIPSAFAQNLFQKLSQSVIPVQIRP